MIRGTPAENIDSKKGARKKKRNLEFDNQP